MKIALVHDSLCGMGGAERVFSYMCEEFQEADIYTLATRKHKLIDSFKNFDIRTTVMQPLMFNMAAVRWAFPINTYVMENMALDQYDIVLTSSASIAKYIRTTGIHVCYCYIPTRALWQTDRYFGGDLRQRLITIILKYLKKRDLNAASRIDQFIAISEDSASHIRKIYSADADVINCPIETEKFKPTMPSEDHYLLVSRLEHWKRVDYAIEAFNQLGLPLRIVGEGSAGDSLRAMAKSNVEFMGSIDDQQLVDEYSRAKAVIFTPELEYGLIALEANACGTPVICLGKGGAREIMIGANESEDKTGTSVFFYEQTPEALMTAVNSFQQFKFERDYLVAHAQKWSIPSFKIKLREYVEKVGTKL